jgi:hypothetical protein
MKSFNEFINEGINISSAGSDDKDFWDLMGDIQRDRQDYIFKWMKEKLEPAFNKAKYEIYLKSVIMINKHFGLNEDGTDMGELSYQLTLKPLFEVKTMDKVEDAADLRNIMRMQQKIQEVADQLGAKRVEIDTSVYTQYYVFFDFKDIYDENLDKSWKGLDKYKL